MAKKKENPKDKLYFKASEERFNNNVPLGDWIDASDGDYKAILRVLAWFGADEAGEFLEFEDSFGRLRLLTANQLNESMAKLKKEIEEITETSPLPDKESTKPTDTEQELPPPG